MSEGEILITLASTIFVLVWWSRWYGRLVKLSNLGAQRGPRGLAFAPALALAGIFGVLRLLASADVRHAPLYLFMYTVMGAAWLAMVLIAADKLGVSWLLDAMERSNPAAALVIGGTLLGGAACYAGGNVGDGPGWWCVVVAGGLATLLWLGLWLAMERLASISETVTVERDTGAGIRFGAWLVASGLMCGRAAAGDWLGLGSTLIDFALVSWPALPLAACAILVERRRARRPVSDQGSWSGPSIGLAVAYLAVAVAVIVLTSLPAENPAYGLPSAEAM